MLLDCSDDADEETTDVGVGAEDERLEVMLLLD